MRRQITPIIVGLLSIICSLDSTNGQNSSPTGELGRTVDSFTSQDYRGQKFELSDLKDSKIVVLAFLGTECPLVKLYGGRLQSIADEFSDQSLTLVGINSNRQDSVTEIGAFMQRHDLKFRLLKDIGNKVADSLGAERTPEIFVLDAERKVRYRGRIDDQYGVGYQRSEPKVHFVKDAINELLAGKPVSNPRTETVGCHIGRIKTVQTKSAVTYCNQVARIIQERCISCHREGEIAPFTLDSYDEVVGWAEMIKEVVNENRMPPWNANPEHGTFANARYLSAAEKKTLNQWVDAGAPKGNETDLPEPKQFVTGWQLSKEPDYVANVSKRPYQIKADGFLDYEHFQVQPDFKEDKWVTEIQLLPGNHRVVHHILVFAVPPGKRMRDIGDGIDGFLAGYVPGLSAQKFPSGMAKRIPAGSRLVFEVHYTPIGSPQTDHSKIGIVFADQSTITHEVVTTCGFQQDFRIPPHESAHPVDARSHRPIGGSKLLGMMPHMHLRGKSFQYTARYPDGSSEILLDVPRYDFNWQLAYKLANPKSLPEGTWIQVDAKFDNSADNLHNPDPTKRVRWGDQTHEEMMIGYFDIAIPMADELRKYDFPDLIQAQGTMYRFDKNLDGKVIKSELPDSLLRMFDKFDHDGDGEVFVREVAKTVAEN